MHFAILYVNRVFPAYPVRSRLLNKTQENE